MTTSNGMLSSMLWFACSKFGWSLEYAVWDVPAAFVFLMTYQNAYDHNDGMMNLQDKELIDNM